MGASHFVLHRKISGNFSGPSLIASASLKDGYLGILSPRRTSILVVIIVEVFLKTDVPINTIYVY